MIKDKDIAQIERLIKLSETHPVYPDTFIPWDTPEDNARLMPKGALSLEGHPLYNQLDQQQKRQLARQEMAQVMWSYAWSEGLACIVFNRRLLQLSPTALEYRYLVKELIEEFRHQDMFSRAVQLLGVEPQRQPHWAKALAGLHLKFMPTSTLFISVLAIELVTDMYGKKIRKDPQVYLPLRKVSELHHIEEGRHIHYTKLWLAHYLEQAGFMKRTFYSFIVMANIWFMRSLYVRKSFYQQIGVSRPGAYAKAARKNLSFKFAHYCYEEAIPFVQGFKGFNFITKPLWRAALKVKIK